MTKKSYLTKIYVDAGFTIFVKSVRKLYLHVGDIIRLEVPNSTKYDKDLTILKIMEKYD